MVYLLEVVWNHLIRFFKIILNLVFLQLLTLIIFAFLGSFFLGALITSVKRGIKEEGWFKFKKEKEEDK